MISKRRLGCQRKILLRRMRPCVAEIRVQLSHISTAMKSGAVIWIEVYGGILISRNGHISKESEEMSVVATSSLAKHCLQKTSRSRDV
jgi:hypothetical protein